MAAPAHPPSPILDATGRPYRSVPPRAVDIAREHAQMPWPAARWAMQSGIPLSPERLARVLKQSLYGSTMAEQYLALAEDMEERDLHYASVLQTRKMAVAGETLEVTPRDESALAQEIAEAFEEHIAQADNFSDMLFDLMDAIAKGYSVVQPHWDTTTRPWTFSEFEWIDPRLFVFDQETMRELHMRDALNPDGVPFEPGQFVVHYPKIKTGIRMRGGIARLAAIAYAFKSANLKWWASFAEVYGMPLRVGHYDPEIHHEDEIADLRVALMNLGHDAAAILPTGMQIDVVDARRPNANGKNIFEGLANYWDAQLSKAVLGQTMTTDDGSSKAQADVHDRVRLDIRRADAKAICSTVRDQIAKPWVLYQYGADAARTLVPNLRLAIEPPEDLTAFTAALLPWVKDGGLRVRASEVREKFGLEEPEGDESDVLGGAPVPKVPTSAF